MDPYLQSSWGDVHGSLMQGIKAALQPQLPPALRARCERRIVLEQTTQDGSVRGEVSEPDVVLLASLRRPFVVHNGRDGGGPLAVLDQPGVKVEPLRIHFSSEPVTSRWVQVIDTRDGDRVVTAIEVLSPSNKRVGQLNRLYRRKLQEYAKGGVSVVEIDLLRSSRRNLDVREEDLPENRRTPYFVAVRRAGEGDEWVIYPIPLDSRLPSIPVPLRRGEADVTMDLQPLIERAYLEGGYDDTDYSKPTEPPLSGDDAAWADGLLKAAGKR